MSAVFAASELLQGLQTGHKYPKGILEILEHELQDIVRDSEPHKPFDQECLLDQIGEFCISVLEVIARLTKTLINGDRMTSHMDERIIHQDAQDELADLRIVEYLDAKRDSLEYPARSPGHCYS
ncbi:MAG: hypothetical protein Q9215_002060 [Flavoplaca cf. flavocitrina]